MATGGIFLTYNTHSNTGKNTALRIQTNAQLYGTKVYLPARMLNRDTITPETQGRIDAASVIVAFTLEPLSHALDSELRYAIQRNKPILVLYDQHVGITVDFGNYARVKQVELDYFNTDDTLRKVGAFLTEQNRISGNNKENREVGLETALLSIGLGLLALWAINRVAS